MSTKKTLTEQITDARAEIKQKENRVKQLLKKQKETELRLFSSL